MESTKESPLKKYRRQPKIYIDLPSKGKFYKHGAVSNDVYTQLAVFSMTPSDDILFKTPDALINGQATVSNIKSCIPAILDPWQIPMIDLDTMLIAIRLASYGPNISVKSKCPHCNTDNSYDIPLQKFIDHYNTLEYDETFVTNGFEISTRPLTYQEYTNNQKQMISFQRALSVQSKTIEDEEKRQEFEKSIITEMTNLNLKIMVMGITKVIIGDEVETDLQEIVNWISDTDVTVFQALKKHIESNVKKWSTPTHGVQCGNEKCKKEHKIIVKLDQSDFFGKG
jgi:hypothetical protein